MAIDETLWIPADLPGSFDLPNFLPEVDEATRSYILRLHGALQRQQVQLSRVIKILNRFRVIVDADKPAATGSNLLWVDTATDTLYYDKPGSPDAWTAL